MSSFLGDAYKKKKILVTGHSGFKGSWLSLWLKDLGSKVVGYSLDPPTKPNMFASINLEKYVTHVVGDIRDQQNVSTVFKENQPEIVFHLAAQPLVRLSYQQPKQTFETNIMGTVNVLEAVRQTESVHTCIIITSDKCYENKEWVYGYRESDPMGGFDPYSASKGCTELVVSSYRNSFFTSEDGKSSRKVALSSVRVGNVIGGGDWASDRIIPDCIRALSSNKQIIIRNPCATRPWQYMLEPLGGYLLLGALMQKYPTKYDSAWNFGPKDANIINVENLVKRVIKNWGSGNFKLEKPAECSHEANLLKLDISKAQMKLGWNPLYDIDQTVNRTVNWYKQFYAGASKDELYKLSLNEIREYTKSINDFDENSVPIKKQKKGVGH